MLSRKSRKYPSGWKHSKREDQTSLGSVAETIAEQKEGNCQENALYVRLGPMWI